MLRIPTLAIHLDRTQNDAMKCVAVSADLYAAVRYEVRVLTDAQIQR